MPSAPQYDEAEGGKEEERDREGERGGFHPPLSQPPTPSMLFPACYLFFAPPPLSEHPENSAAGNNVTTVLFSIGSRAGVTVLFAILKFN